MSEKIPHSDNPKIQAKIDKAVHRDSVIDHTLRWVLHYIERFIAVMTILALLGSLALLPAAELDGSIDGGACLRDPEREPDHVDAAECPESQRAFCSRRLDRLRAIRYPIPR